MRHHTTARATYTARSDIAGPGTTDHNATAARSDHDATAQHHQVTRTTYQGTATRGARFHVRGGAL